MLRIVVYAMDGARFDAEHLPRSVLIAAEGRPEAAPVALAVGPAFGPGGSFVDRRVAAVRSLCADAAVHYRACEPGEMAVLPGMAEKSIYAVRCITARSRFNREDQVRWQWESGNSSAGRSAR